jgi:pantothenate kinase
MGERFVEGIMLKLTKYKDINEGFKNGFLSGDNKACDMTVGDIYGSGCTSLGIKNYKMV